MQKTNEQLMTLWLENEMLKQLVTGLLVAIASVGMSMGNRAVGEDHLWTDSTGHYKLEAEFIAGNDRSVVLQLTNGRLLIVEIKQLSAKDKQYLKDLEQRRKEAQKDRKSADGLLQKWNLKNGTEIQGAVAEYGRRLVQVRRYRNKIYVNDRPFDSLPDFYQQMIPDIINHFEETQIKDKKGLEQWLRRQAGSGKSFSVEGVMLELEDGELMGVPFFLFNEKDAKLLKPGWNDWLDADEDAKYQAESALRLQAEVIADRRARRQSLEMQRLQLHLEAYDAGLFDLWKVTVTPPPGRRGLPMQVIVPGRNSAQASQAALQRYPGYRVIAAAKVNRRW